MCLPDFDSPSVFASLLDQQKGGCFEIMPLIGGLHFKQLYLPDSNILLTRFLSDRGVAEISDYMAMGTALAGRSLVRRVKAVRHGLRFRVRCAPRFDYGRAPHQTLLRGQTVYFQPRTPADLILCLRSSVPLSVRVGDAFAEFSLEEGESASFILQQAGITVTRGFATALSR